MTDTTGPPGLDRRTALKRFGQLALGLSVAPTLAACGSSGGGSRDVARIGFAVQEMDSLNPFVAQNAFSAFAIQCMYPMLVNLDGPKFEVIPDLARTWDIAPDGRSITFHLKTGGKWSDGRPVTADDVKFTIDMVQKFAGGPTAIAAGHVANVERVTVQGDDVVLHYKTPTASALADLARFPILPRQQWAAAATGKGKGLAELRVAGGAISGGPFVLKRYKEKEIVLLERNPSFYGTPPKYRRLGFSYFSTQSAMLTALRAKNIDAVVRIDPQPKLDLGKGLRVTPVDGFRIDYLGFNSNPKKPEHRELLDRRVRTALSQAIDLKTYVSQIFFGQAGEGGSFVPPAAGAWHDPSIQPPQFDPERAGAMLDQLGYRKGSDGIRRTPSGKMQYVLNAANDNSSASRKAEIVRESFAAIGVKVTPKLLDAAAMFEAVSGPNVKYLTNDLHMWSWAALPDPGELLSYLKSDQLGAYSDVAYQNPAYDRLWQQQAAELDVAKRRALVYQLQQIVMRDKPYVVLSYPNQISAHWDYVNGLVPTPNTEFNWLSKGPELRMTLA